MRKMWIGTHCKKSMYLRYRSTGEMHCSTAVLQPGNEETIKQQNLIAVIGQKKCFGNLCPFPEKLGFIKKTIFPAGNFRCLTIAVFNNSCGNYPNTTVRSLHQSEILYYCGFCYFDCVLFSDGKA